MCRQGWLSSSLRAPIARFPRGRRSGRAPISAPCGCAGVTRVSLPVSPDFWLLFHAGFATASSVGSVRQIHRRFRPASPRCRQAPMSNRHAGEARAGSAGERACGARRRPGTPTGLGAACRRARMVARRRACTRRSASGLGAACRPRGWWRVVGGGWWRVVGRGCGRLASGLDAACRRARTWQTPGSDGSALSGSGARVAGPDEGVIGRSWRAEVVYQPQVGKFAGRRVIRGA